ncbi:MAG TPA: hypothetical protein VFD94_06575 [Jatrophihabitans sp.]|jgi:hypothetical protein|nr:hypothetical protein [Jatrophihabitans sp.]
MWEVRAADGRAAELLAWVLDRSPAGSQVYRSADRVVVIDPAGTARERLADPPAGLVARPAQAWDFELVRNG